MNRIRGRLARIGAFMRESGWRLDYLGYRLRLAGMRANRVSLPWALRFRILIGIASARDIVWAAETAVERKPKVRTLATKTQAGAAILDWKRRDGVCAKATG